MPFIMNPDGLLNKEIFKIFVYKIGGAILKYLERICLGIDKGALCKLERFQNWRKILKTASPKAASAWVRIQAVKANTRQLSSKSSENGM